MASNGNGWTKWLVGVLFTITFTAITTITTNVISNDQAARQRDVDMNERFHKHCVEAEAKFYQYAMKQERHNSEQNVKLERIITTLDYIKRNGTT